MKNKPLYIFIDMDDTLIDTKGVYDVARRAVYELLGSNYKDVRKDFESFRAQSIKKNNEYRAQKIDATIRTPQSILDAAKEAVDNMSYDIEREILRLGERVFTTIPQPIRNAEKSLKTFKAMLEKHGLEEDVKLVVLTQGEEPWQLEKFNALPQSLKDVFDDVIVVSDKKKATYERVLQERNIDPADAIMIGDKEGSDILPALDAGMSTFHIPVYGALDFKGLFKSDPKEYGDRYNRKSKMSQALRTIASDRLGLKMRNSHQRLGYSDRRSFPKKRLLRFY